MCHYVILPQDKEINGNLEEYGYVVFGSTQGYVIYRDTTPEWWNFQS